VRNIHLQWLSDALRVAIKGFFREYILITKENLL